MTKPFALTALVRVLDIAVAFFLGLFLIVALTGGISITVMGVSLKEQQLFGPLKYLVPLLLIRLTLTVRIRELTLILGSVVFALAVSELALRVWNAPIIKPGGLVKIHQPSPDYGWELIPGSSGVTTEGVLYEINSVGMRDTEHSREKLPGVYRIAVIGDSFTFGMAVNLEDTYPKQLQRILGGLGISAEVLNFGVIGHGMWQHHEMLKKKAIAYQPDLVVLGIFMDDLFHSRVPEEAQADNYEGIEPPFAMTKADLGLLTNFAVWNFLDNFATVWKYRHRARRGAKHIASLEKRKKKYGPSHSLYQMISGKYDKRFYSDFGAVLAQFVASARDAGSEVLVVMIPDSVQLNDEHVQGVNRFVRQAAAEIEVPFLDTTPVLEKEPDVMSLYLFPQDAHNSPKGLMLIAEAIAETIVDRDLWRRQATDTTARLLLGQGFVPGPD